jgi:hypothetical protein
MALDLEAIPVEEPPVKDGSTLAKIRALYRQAKGEQHLDLPLPRNPLLRVRYLAVDPDDVTDTATTGRERNLDILIAACQTMLMRTDDGQWEPLTDGGEPVRFDETLSSLLGLGVAPIEQGGTAREIVTAAFSTAPSPPLAVANHVILLTNWMAGEGEVDEESLLGES